MAARAQRAPCQAGNAADSAMSKGRPAFAHAICIGFPLMRRSHASVAVGVPTVSRGTAPTTARPLAAGS
eukprot:9647328-Alexandrium_andersonii.AAC.1